MDETTTGYIRPDRLEWNPVDTVSVARGGSLLGEGSFGSVYRGVFDGDYVAIKVIKAPPVADGEHASRARIAAERQHAREIKRLLELRFKHVVQCYGISKSPLSSETLIITECLQGGSLHHSLDKARAANAPLDNISFLHIASHIAKGLLYLHNSGFIHGDMKPHNVLLTASVSIDYENHIASFPSNVDAKIADFGMSKRLQSHTHGIAVSTVDFGNHPCGTYAYMAPESFHGVRDLSDDQLKSVDIYAFGVLLYEILSGMIPWKFEGVQSPMHLQRLVCFERVRPSWGPRRNLINPEYVTLVERCWQEDSQGRPSAKMLLKRFQAWLSDANTSVSFDTQLPSAVSSSNSSRIGSNSDAGNRNQLIVCNEPPLGQTDIATPFTPVESQNIGNSAAAESAPPVGSAKDGTSQSTYVGAKDSHADFQSGGNDSRSNIPTAFSEVKRVSTGELSSVVYDDSGSYQQDDISGTGDTRVLEEADPLSQAQSRDATHRPVTSAGGESSSSTANVKRYWEMRERAPDLPPSNVNAAEYDPGDSVVNLVEGHNDSVNRSVSATDGLINTFGPGVVRVHSEQIGEPVQPALALPGCLPLPDPRGQNTAFPAHCFGFGESYIKAVNNQNQDRVTQGQPQIPNAVSQALNSTSESSLGLQSQRKSSTLPNDHENNVHENFDRSCRVSDPQDSRMSSMNVPEMPAQRLPLDHYDARAHDPRNANRQNASINDVSHPRTQSVDSQARLNSMIAALKADPTPKSTASFVTPPASAAHQNVPPKLPVQGTLHSQAQAAQGKPGVMFSNEYAAGSQRTSVSDPKLSSADDKDNVNTHLGKSPPRTANIPPNHGYSRAEPSTSVGITASGRPAVSGCVPISDSNVDLAQDSAKVAPRPTSSQSLSLSAENIAQMLSQPGGKNKILSLWKAGQCKLIISALTRDDLQMNGVARLNLISELTLSLCHSHSQTKNPIWARDLCIALGNAAKMRTVEGGIARATLYIPLTAMQSFQYDAGVYSAACYAVANLLKKSNDAADERKRNDIVGWIAHAIAFNNHDHRARKATLASTAASAARNFVWMNDLNAKAFFIRRQNGTLSAAEHLRDSMLHFQADPSALENSFTALSALCFFRHHRTSLLKIRAVSAISSVMDRPLANSQWKLVAAGVDLVGIMAEGPLSSQDITFVSDIMIQEHGVRMALRALDAASRNRVVLLMSASLKALLTMARLHRAVLENIVQTGGVGIVVQAIFAAVDQCLSSLTANCTEMLCNVARILCNHPAALTTMRQSSISRPLSIIVSRFSHVQRVAIPGNQALRMLE